MVERRRSPVGDRDTRNHKTRPSLRGEGGTGERAIEKSPLEIKMRTFLTTMNPAVSRSGANRPSSSTTVACRPRWRQVCLPFVRSSFPHPFIGRRRHRLVIGVSVSATRQRPFTLRFCSFCVQLLYAVFDLRNGVLPISRPAGNVALKRGLWEICRLDLYNFFF